MEKTELCDLLKRTTYLVNVYQDGELVSQGSGVSFNENGDIITAAHVISGRLPVQKKDLKNLSVQARVEGKSFDHYLNYACGLSFSLPQLKEPVTIDLALLKNHSNNEKRDFLKIQKDAPEEGNEILMAGYSDEVNMPFAIEHNFDLNHPDFKGHEEEIQFAKENWMRFSMFKSGMIGKKNGINLTDSSIDFKFTGHNLYIDNVMHSGASGGPVINKKGELIGIITQRAITTVPYKNSSNLKVPSGSAIAISPHTIIDYYERQKGSLDYTAAS